MAETHSVECILEGYDLDADRCYYIGALYSSEFDSYDAAHRAYMALNPETTTLRVFMAARYPDMNVYVSYFIDDDFESYPLT